MKKCPECGKTYNDVYSRCTLCSCSLVWDTEVVIQCPSCKEKSKLDYKPNPGQRLVCPYCSNKFVYGADSIDSRKSQARPSEEPQGDRWAFAFAVGALLVAVSCLVATKLIAPILIGLGAALAGLAIGRVCSGKWKNHLEITWLIIIFALIGLLAVSLSVWENISMLDKVRERGNMNTRTYPNYY